MNGPSPPQTGKDHGRAVIIATKIFLLTCIFSFATVLIVLIFMNGLTQLLIQKRLEANSGRFCVFFIY
jgi:hypothetical protein